MPKTPREIVLAAYHFLADVLPPTQKISNVSVEEVRPYDEAATKFWNVVLSYDNAGEFPFDRKKEYKKFKITDEGIVVSMEVQNVPIRLS